MRLLAFLKRHEGSIKTWADVLSNVAQVIALLLAGIWAYTIFDLSESPGLKPRGLTDAELRWDPLPDARDACLASFVVHFHNTGKRAIDVSDVRITGWLYDRPASVERPRFIDLKDLEQHGNPFFDQPFPNATLTGHYAPDTTRTETFQWYFHRQPGKFALFRVRLKTDPPQPAHAYDLKDVCR